MKREGVSAIEVEYVPYAREHGPLESRIGYGRTAKITLTLAAGCDLGKIESAIEELGLRVWKQD